MLDLVFWSSVAVAVWGIGALLALHWPHRMRGIPIEWDPRAGIRPLGAHEGAGPE